MRSTAVQAGSLLDTEESAPAESHHLLLEWINFLIVAVVLAYLLRKPMARFFAERLDTIREGLEEGRRAMAESEAKLAEVEKKLKNLEQEIADFRARSEVEMRAERERLREAAEREAQRVMDFAQTQIEAAVRAAQVELKRYAAAQAVELAESVVRRRLDDPLRNKLVSQFVAELKEPHSKN
ncbi:MAG TPA: ATP synthase F0 subunit B [Terriglobales bacterium]|nr:ATP synthase F0 subunit B [Terriglobales bacterium]